MAADLETVRLYTRQPTLEGEHKMNFAMLVSYLRQQKLVRGIDTVIVEVGVWRLEVKLLGDGGSDE